MAKIDSDWLSNIAGEKPLVLNTNSCYVPNAVVIILFILFINAWILETLKQFSLHLKVYVQYEYLYTNIHLFIHTNIYVSMYIII